jgi:hypothetical protein
MKEKYENKYDPKNFEIKVPQQNRTPTHVEYISGINQID